jgi:hypothetical protein
MSKKMMLLALAAVSAVMFALPAVASAGEWKIDPAGVGFKIAGGEAKLSTSGGRTVICTSNSGEGSYDAGSQTTGTISLIFHGCTSAGTACTTTGQTSGTIISTPKLPFHNVYLGDGKTTPGTLITGTGETKHLAEFKCGFGLVSITVTGSVLGHGEEGCDETEQEKRKVNFESPSHGVQKFTTVTNTGPTVYDLHSLVNGTVETSAQSGTGTLTFIGSKTKVTCV